MPGTTTINANINLKSIWLPDPTGNDGKGDELVRELRAADNRIPIISVSSHDEGNTALMNAGATAICGKMQFDQIQTVIDQAVLKLNN